MEYPIPFTRRTKTNAASAMFSTSSTVKTYANRPPGYGHNQCDGKNFTVTHTPASVA